MPLIAKLIVAAALAAPALASASPPEPAGPAQTPRVLKPAVLRGRDLVQRRCAGCHNAAPRGRSVYGPAPPLRTLGGRYTPAELQRVVEEARAGDHYAMPPLEISERQALDIAAYIEAIAKSDAGTQRKLAVPSCVGLSC
ncbi:cytochrome oxidase subunit II [Phenylobacterium zucineum HLK1]|uniref:Cytochrome oxidase subunit II n=1 Tax=Phenylobacterium zucineum (strain HLK1) TaxID=450851 RepID=B4R8A6_PHEZH|nr:cytochrome c [Phenylobacterium zucineum]ACG79224.1 cytochrome oxidase subunit II [Phenylobacterium zucineum HLK1]